MNVPTAAQLSSGEARVEYLYSPGHDLSQAWFAAGLEQGFQFEQTLERGRPGTYIGSFNFSWQFVAPITDFAPGFSLGIRDVLNRTRDGRAVYAVMTHRIGNIGLLQQDIPTQLSLGVWSQDQGAAFVGVTLPFAEQLVLFTEHDGLRLTGGFELSPLSGLGFRVMFRQDQTAFGMWFQRQF